MIPLLTAGIANYFHTADPPRRPGFYFRVSEGIARRSTAEFRGKVMKDVFLENLRASGGAVYLFNETCLKRTLEPKESCSVFPGKNFAARGNCGFLSRINTFQAETGYIISSADASRAGGKSPHEGGIRSLGKARRALRGGARARQYAQWKDN